MTSPVRRKRPAGGALANHPQPADVQRPDGNKAKPTGRQAAQLVADPRFRRRMQRFHALGSRVAAELLAQLAAEHDCRAEIEHFLDRAVENEEAIRAFGFNEWPELPLRAVPRR